MKKLITVLLVLSFVTFSISGCETSGIENVSETIPAYQVVVTPQLLIYTAEDGVPKYEPVYTSVHSEEDENYIWNELSRWSPNDQIAAGVMGYFWKESFLRSDAVAGWAIRNYFHGQDEDICLEFTRTVDEGLKDSSSREYFIEMVQVHYGGYGLGQWLHEEYLNDLYDFVREREGSIGDAALQCEFIFRSIQKNEELWESLLECENARQCGRRMGTMYDGTCSEHAEAIADKANLYYKKYHVENGME